MCIIKLMKILNPKNTLKKTIPFMSLMIALNAILTFSGFYIPLFGYVLALFLPLISAIYCLQTKYRYFPIYFVCSLALSCAVSFQDLSFVIIYTLPSLLMGFLMAICIAKNLDGITIYFFSSLILFGFEIIAIYFVNFIYNIDIIENVLKIFRLNNIEGLDWIVYGLIYLLNCIKMFIIYFVCDDELQKLGYKIDKTKVASLEIIIAVFLFSIAEMITWHFKLYQYSFVLLFISTIGALLLALQVNRKYSVIANVCIFTSIGVSWILYISFIDIFGTLKSFLILIIFPLAMSIFSLIFFIDNKKFLKGKKGTIND